MFDKLKKKTKKKRYVAHDHEHRAKMPKQKPHTSHQSYGTPWMLMKGLRKAGFVVTWDLAATKDNAKAKRFITPEQDTFTVDWSKLKGVLFLNPPFGKIKQFVAYCVRMMKKGAHILFLVPASVGSNWFRDHVWHHGYVHYLKDRIPFIKHGKKKKQGYPKDCMIVEFKKSLKPVSKGGHRIWSWKTGEVW